MIKHFCKEHRIHPRQWLLGLVSYSRFIGYIKPALASGNSVDYRIWRKLLAGDWEPRELSCPVGRRILVISPHADDEAIGAGGILWAHRAAAEIHIVVLTDGTGYGFVAKTGKTVEQAKAELVETRKQELLKTAKALNAASVSFLGFTDRAMAVNEASVLQLRTVLESVRPDVVILPWFLDGHPDHRAANVLFAKACYNRSALVLGYEIWSVLDPNAYFEITDHLDAKLTLVKNYVSQLKEVDYLTFAQGLAWVRGYQLVRSKRQKKAAEAFVALPAEDYCSLVNEVLG
jgi:N-acetylglucosamine malate deacetylase 1